MNPDNSSLPPASPAQPPPVPPVRLEYSRPDLVPNRGLITTMGIFGILMASLGLIYAAYEIWRSIASAFLTWANIPTPISPGVVLIGISSAVVGAGLAVALLKGSVDLLRLRPDALRILLWWGWIYLFSVVLFLLLEIFIAIPGELGMYNRIFSAMPTTLPTAIPSGGPVASTTYSFPTVTATATSSATTIPAAFTPAPPNPAQMTGFMQLGLTILAVCKAAVSLIFPIVMLILLRLKSVRAALGR